MAAPRPNDGGKPAWWSLKGDNKARIYVLALPGNPERTVAIVVRGPRATFDKLVEGAKPILDSLELPRS